jgi:hypothetical protein
VRHDSNGQLLLGLAIVVLFVGALVFAVVFGAIELEQQRLTRSRRR